MVIIIVENMTEGFRGELTKWFLEVKAGVFVGNISALVRDNLWQKVAGQRGMGSALMISSADTEQGYSIEMVGNPRRSVVDMEGLYLIRTIE